MVLHDEKELLEVNPAAVRIMRRQSAAELLGQHPSDLAPPVQPNGESSAVLGRQYVEECLIRGSARFDWLACAPNGEDGNVQVNSKIGEGTTVTVRLPVFGVKHEKDIGD